MEAVVSKPQVFDDQEQERVFERVAAVDVAKASGVVCLRLPHPAQPSGRRSQVWEVPATMHAVTELAGRLAAEGVQKVTLESTSDYWRIWFYVLEKAGLAVQLVNASQAGNLPGRPKGTVGSVFGSFTSVRGRSPAAAGRLFGLVMNVGGRW
jgi:hypothetical protein